MIDDPRQWKFVADMNFNGNVTISDVWLWCKWLYFYPGDWLLGLMIHKIPLYANSLELSYDDYGGFLSGVISFFVYSSLLWLLIKTIEEIKEDFDRWRANRKKQK